MMDLLCVALMALLGAMTFGLAGLVGRLTAPATGPAGPATGSDGPATDPAGTAQGGMGGQGRGGRASRSEP
jgi:hypothetical protein